MVSRKSQIVAVCFALIIVFLFSFIGDRSPLVSKEAALKISPIYRKATLDIDPFSALHLKAAAVYVFDVKNNKAIYAKNENAQLPLASLVKLMTALIAVLNIPDYEIVTITSDAIKKEGDSNFTVGERWPLKNIIGLTLMSSSNDGAAAIASAFDLVAGRNDSKTPETFVDKMNEMARDLGLKQTYFLNETGLDISYDLSGAYGSAKDVSMLMIHILNKESAIVEITSYDSAVVNSFESEHKIKNTNRIIGDIPGLVFSKTGYTDLAGGNLSIIFEAGPNRPIAITILGSTEEGRFDDMKSLVSATLQSMQETR